MPSEKEIVIYALQHIGQFADLVSLEEDSSFAAVARAAYPFTRDALLERHTWNFATCTKSIAPMTEKTATGLNAFPIPTDAVRVIHVYVNGDRKVDWQMELVGDARCVVSKGSKIVIRYTKRVENTDFFSPGFAEALSWNLAAAVAGPIIKGETGIVVTQKLVNYAQMRESQAAHMDAKQGNEKQFDYIAPWHNPARCNKKCVAEGGKPTPMSERGDFKK